MPMPSSLRLASYFKKPNQANTFHFFSLFSFSTTTPSSEHHHSNPTRHAPPPIRVALTDSAGRGVFATRRISTGDLIHTAEPAVCHPSRSATHTVCYSCLRKLPNSPNSESTRVSFCSEDCKRRCKRLACMVISGVAKSDSLDILQPANLTTEMILKMEEEFALLRNALTKALIADEHLAFLTKQWYISVLARIRINAFRIELAGGLYEDLLSSAVASVEAGAAVGHAVYILPSFYDHDCG